MAKWGEISCPRCAEQDALWEGMERSLEEGDAREARLEVKLAKAVKSAFYEGFYEGGEGGRVSPAWKQSATLAELKGGKNE